MATEPPSGRSRRRWNIAIAVLIVIIVLGIIFLVIGGTGGPAEKSSADLAHLVV